LTQLVAGICDVPIAVISLVDKDRQWFKSKVGIEAQETPREVAFCAHAILGKEVLIVPDTQLDERFASNPLVVGDPKIRFYAGAPIVTHSGQALGTLCAIDQTPRELTDAQLNALRVLSHQVSTLLELRLRKSQLDSKQKEFEGNVLFLNSLKENAADAIYLHDLKGQFIEVNQTACDHTGYTREELLSRHVWEIVANFPSLEMIEKAWSEIKVDHPITLEGRHVRKDGSTFPVEVRLARAQGTPEDRILAFARDVSERKAAELERAKLLELKENRGKSIVGISTSQAVASGDLATVMRLTTEAATNLLEIARTSFWSLGEGEGNSLVCRHLFDRKDGHSIPDSILEEHQFPNFFAAISDGRVIEASDAQKDPRTMEFNEDFLVPTGVASMLEAPVRISGKVVGLLCMKHEGEARKWDSDEVSFAGELAEQLALTIQNKERAEQEAAIRSIIEATSVVGHAFFQSLVKELANALKVRYAMVARYLPETVEGEAIAVWADGGLTENFTYSLVGTPCHIVSDQEICFHSSNVQGAFPEDKLLVELGVESYSGMPCFSSDGKPNGLLIVMNDGPIKHQKIAESLLKIFASRVGSELDRLQAETARKESEEQFRQLAENIREVFWITNLSGRKVEYISPAYEEIWGKRCQQLLDEPFDWVQSIHPDDRDRIRKAALTKQKEGLFDEVYRIVRPDGLTRWIHDRAFPVKDKDGQVQRVVGLAEDITERRQLEDQLRHAQKMEAIGEMAGGIAHDFNNILSIISGNSEEALLDLDKSHPAHLSVSEIEKGTKRAKDLVKRILTFSRQESPIRKAISLQPVITEAAQFLRATLPAGVDLRIACAGDPPSVLADATQVQQILLNLGNNALRALDGNKGSMSIRLGTSQLSDLEAQSLGMINGGACNVIKIEDTGKGIPKDIIDRIFDPFFTTKSTGEGTGLGLSVVHGLMKAHDGGILVNSIPGEGTCFELYFPNVDDDPGTTRIFRRPAAHGGGQHLMVVDDERQLVDLAQRTLVRKGYKVSGFTEPEEALKTFIAAPESFDLVLTDYNMPGISGLEFSSSLLECRQDIPIVLISGYLTDEIRKKATALGIKRTLNKPNSISEMAEDIKEILEDIKDRKEADGD